MARVLYFDCFAGAAGDMILGALLDAGVPEDGLRSALGSLGVDHDFRVSRVVRAGISANHVEVVDRGRDRGHHDHADPHDHHGHDHHDHDHPVGHGHRSLEEIAHLIGHSGLSTPGKDRALRLFRRLGEAESAIHGVSLDRVHLHEVGAVDSIIDIVGAVHALEWLGIDDVVASPLNVGSGTVTMAHGTFPVPAPATLRLLAGVPIYSSGLDAELLTPTGALVVSDYARSYGPMPPMRVERVGYGAGTRNLDPVPNVLRVVIGERTAEAPPAGGAVERVVEIACEIDDMNPQLFGPLSDRLFRAGALDVFLTPVQMKKGRPGTLVTVLGPVDLRGALASVLFAETTTLGVRWHTVERDILPRRHETVTIDGGAVRIKLSAREGVLNAAPEFDDCVRIADATGRAVKTVYADALRAWSLRNRPE